MARRKRSERKKQVADEAFGHQAHASAADVPASDTDSEANVKASGVNDGDGAGAAVGSGGRKKRTSKASESGHREPGSTGGKPAKAVLFPQLPSLSRIMSVVMLIFGILAVGALFYRLMVGFFVPLFLAALLVVIFRPVHDWMLVRSRFRKRLAAGGTTGLILLMVLLPIGLLLSVGATQFTIMLSQLNQIDVAGAMDRVRSQLSLNLEHPEHFRELDRLIDSLDLTPAPDSDVDLEAVALRARSAAGIVAYLQSELANGRAEQAAKDASTNLTQFADVLMQNANASRRDAIRDAELEPQGDAIPAPAQLLSAYERFDLDAGVAVASTRRWMHVVLGGAVSSQLKLIANPSEADLATWLRRVRDGLQPRFVSLSTATGGILMQLLFGLVILIVSVYFFLIDGPTMIKTLMRLSPLDDQYERQLLLEFDRTSRAVVLASVLSALVQGALAAIAYYFCDFDQLVLLFLLTSVMALVPFLGAASVWVPCVVWLGIVEQRWGASIGLGLYGVTLVSSIDNVIKVFVLHGRSQLHPLFALLSVIGGVSVFGPVGILVGPMVVVFLQTLLEILNHELAEGDDTGRSGADAATQAVDSVT
ncbi:MAG: AI-2E family transporter [Planctomycetota bacterium]